MSRRFIVPRAIHALGLRKTNVQFKSSCLRNQQIEISGCDFTEFPCHLQKSAGWSTRPQTEIAPSRTGHSTLPPLPVSRFGRRLPPPRVAQLSARPSAICQWRRFLIGRPQERSLFGSLVLVCHLSCHFRGASIQFERDPMRGREEGRGDASGGRTVT